MALPPTKYDQAIERARDDLDRTELTNILLDLPAVCTLDVFGESESWDNTMIEVVFEEDYGHGVEETIDIMQRQGWQVEEPVFSRQILRFVSMGGDK